MARTLTAGVIAQVGAGKVLPAVFAYFNFASGALRVWSGVGSITWGGNTYTGLGDMLGISPVQEVKGTRASGLSFRLNGVPSSLVTIALADNYRGRECTVWMGFINSSEAIVSDPVQLFSGRMDQMAIDDQGVTATITLQAESRFIELERARERRYTDQDQQQLYPGDLGLEYVAGLQDKDIPWGQQAKTTAGVGGGGSSIGELE